MGRPFSSDKSRSSTGAGSLSVRIYNKEREGELHQIQEGLTCENVCLEIGRKLQISPTLLHCFSLKKYSKSRPNGIWLSPQDELKIQTDQANIHFRMRFIPHCQYTADIFQNKHLKDDNCLKYLFWQINWDFLHDRIDCYLQHNKERARGLIVLCVLIQMRLYTELQQLNNTQRYTENLDNYLVSCNKNLKSFFPDSMKGTFLDRVIPVIERNIKSKVKDNQKDYPFDDERFNSLALMKSFIRSVLQEETGFFREHYSAYKVEFATEPVPQKPDELTAVYKGREQLALIVDISCRPAEIFIHKHVDKTRIPIDRLSDLKLTFDETSQMEKVHIFVMDRPPEELYFEEREEALSFITCVETYYRLCINFYQSLCPRVEPRTVKEMNTVKAHGPVSDYKYSPTARYRDIYFGYNLEYQSGMCRTEIRPHFMLSLILSFNVRKSSLCCQQTDYIQHKLGKQYGSSSDVYVLRKSLNEYDGFEIVRHVKGTDRLRVSSLGKLHCTQEGYFFDESKEPMKDLKKLMHDTICEVEGLVSCSRIYPKFEACDVLKEFFLQEDTLRIQEEDEEDMQQRQEFENQPKIIMPGDLAVKNLIGKGYFTEVRQGLLKNEETVIVKRLRLNEIMRELDGKPNSSQRLAILQEAFCESFEKLMKLRSRKFFLDFLGQRLQYPLEMVIKEEKYGNLQYFLETRNRYEIPLTMHHLQTITIQLANALEYMEEKNCFHGNLHCKNIIVTKFARHEMLIKITDPGMVSYYNRLHLETETNRNRLPWIAPELYKNLTAVNIRTEVYSYGMTLWQTYEEGKNPVNHAFLTGRTVPEMCQIFSKEEFQLPCPRYLTPCVDDCEEIKKIKKKLFKVIRMCCHADQERRLSPKEILKELLKNVYDNAQAYHDYNIIYEGKSSSYSFRNLSTAQASSGTGGTSGIITKYNPVAVPIRDIVGMDVNEEDTAPTFIDSCGQGNSLQGTVGSLEPGFLLTHEEKHVQMPPCPVHQACVNPQEPKRSAMDPIVSDVKFIIAENRLTIHTESTLGSGHYGTIHKGTLELSSGLSELVPVAVKALKENQAEKFREEFKKEASIMEKLSHPNIVKFYGIYQEGRYMVMELVENGSLHSYVGHRTKRIPEIMQLQISIDIALGMDYLESEKIIHCDLAARNVLLTLDLKAKVSDFGLSKVLREDKDYYRRIEQRTIPILWCAPEWIAYKKFFHKSDVWSFGVVLWEIYSYGKLPVIGNDNNLNNFYKSLYENKRLEKPKYCSQEMYSLMNSCWIWEEDKRPTFSELKNRLEYMLQKVREERGRDNSSENQGNGKNVSKTSIRTDTNSVHQDGVNHAQIVRNTTAKVNGHAEGDQHETNYRKANPAANFVEKDENKTENWLTKTIVPFPTDSSKTAPERRSPDKPLLKGNNTIHEMTQTKVLRSSDLLVVIETGLTVNRDHVLGEGQFGKVLSGVYKGNVVAVKTCVNESYRERFKREYGMLQVLEHPNIVKFVGIYRPENGCGVEYVMEFMEKGSLRSLLQSHKNLPVSLYQKIKFLNDIAKGMNFLFENHILHGDLTAENILVNGKDIAKISDFGLCKHLDTEDGIYTRNEAIVKPVISPPESLKKQYTKYSDIWSFGVLCYEVFLDGNQPNFHEPLDFQEICRTGDIKPLFSKLEAGERFEKPENCPDELYGAICRCWEWNPKDRVQYRELIETLTVLIKKMPEQV